MSVASQHRHHAAVDVVVYRAGDLAIDTGRQRVMRGEQEIALPKLSFDLLLALLRAAPNVVSTDALMQEVWRDLVVGPETVSQRVKLLRDALGDDPHHPRYIAGLRGRGYRLIVPVTCAAGAHLEHAAARSSAHAMSQAPTRDRWMPGASLAVSISAFVLIAIMAVIPWMRIEDSPRDAAPPPASVSGVELPDRTVAVLPFENLSADPQNEYLALGVADMVLDRLSSVSDLLVIARSSSFRFRGTDLDAQEIGRRLRARYLVDGSVQRSEDRLRVAVRLVDAQNGSQLHGLHFDRTLVDIFSIEDEIADSIAGALETTLMASAEPAARGARSENLDAWLAYLQGRTLLEKFTVVGFEAAARQFERAIALDRKFAAAYVALADARMSEAWRRLRFEASSPSDARLPIALVRKGAALVDRALALDPSLGAAYIWRANYLDEPEQAGANYRKGLDLDPSNGLALTRYSEFLWQQGKRAAARQVLERALRVDPLSARAHYLKADHLADDPAVQERAMLDVLDIDPSFNSAWTRLAVLRWWLGDMAVGIKFAERAVAADPQTPWSRYLAYVIYLDIGDLAAARDISAGTAGSSGNATFQMLQYLGDWRAAGEAAYEVPVWLRGHLLTWNDAAAVRDLALRTGDHQRAVRFVEASYELGEPRRLSGISIHRAVTLAHLLRAGGRKAASLELLEQVFAWLDPEDEPSPCVAARHFCSDWALRRVRADALALQGNRSAALDALAEAFLAGDLRLWWYTVDQDPLWADMRADPHFQAIAAEARAHAAGQRAILAEMRRKGEVPFRPAQARVARASKTTNRRPGTSAALQLDP